tara:strand:- start:69 stop:305 length:237 start_codon:yes stop_codon:yes gene_type:complete
MADKKKTQVVELDGEKVKIKKGALRDMLGVPKSYKFNKTSLKRINKTDIGKSFEFQGKRFKMTNLMKKRITLAITLMK